MVGCNSIGKEEIYKRKLASDERDNTDLLTRHTSSNSNSKASEIRDFKDGLEIKKLEDNDIKEYFYKLLEEE